jgi:hypothetical protein
VPLLLIVVEAGKLSISITLSDGIDEVFPGLFSAEVGFHMIYSNATLPSMATTKVFNDLLSVAFFISFATTLTTTTLIAYRIHSASKNGGFPRRPFKHAIDIVVQSGAVYALTLLATAISGIGAGGDVRNTRTTALDDYTQAVNYPLTVSCLLRCAVAVRGTEPRHREFRLPSWSRGWPFCPPRPPSHRQACIYPASNFMRDPPTRRVLKREWSLSIALTLKGSRISKHAKVKPRCNKIGIVFRNCKNSRECIFISRILVGS